MALRELKHTAVPVHIRQKVLLNVREECLLDYHSFNTDIFFEQVSPNLILEISSALIKMLFSPNRKIPLFQWRMTKRAAIHYEIRMLSNLLQLE